MILLVEDNEDDVFIMKRALKKLGSTLPVYNAVNGQVALDYLQGSGEYADRTVHPLPKVVFLDLKLPYVHGFEVLSWIRQQPSMSQIPVAVLTSSPEGSDREKAYGLGANTYLVKPPGEELISLLLQQIQP